MVQVELTVPSHSELVEAVQRVSGQNVNLCYQCSKCASGCPVAYQMDYTPVQIIHAIQLGLSDLVFNSKTMWLCASCETCSTRCPQGIEISRVMDAVKIMALRRGVKPAVPRVAAFYNAALGNIRTFGRMFELGMIMSLKLKTLEFFRDLGLGMKMLRKGKLKLLPNLGGARATRRIFRRVHKLEKEVDR